MNDQTEHCCQLAEIGGFEQYEEDAYGIAEDKWFETHKGERETDMPITKLTPAVMAEAIDRDLAPDMSHFATTAADQGLAEKALRKLGFKHIGSFPGTGIRDLKIWLRPRTPTKRLILRRKTTDGGNLRQRAKRQSASKRA